MPERASSASRKPEVSQRNSQDNSRSIQRDRDSDRINQKADKARMSSKDAIGESREKYSSEKSDGFAQNADVDASTKQEVIQQSHKIIKKLNSNDDSSVESELSALRADEAVGEFWQSLDDQAALELIDSLEAMTPEMLTATLSLLKNMSVPVPQLTPEVEEQPELIEAIDAISDEEETEMPEGDEDSSESEEFEAISAQAVSVSTGLPVQEAPESSESEEIPVETEAVTLDSKSQNDAITKAAARDVAKPVVSEKKSEAPVSEKKADTPVTDSQTEDVLSALRSNPETSEFWKSVDDETAHKLLSVLSKMKGSRTDDELVAALSGEKPAETDSELLTAVSAESSSQIVETPVEANTDEKRTTRNTHEKAEGTEDSTIVSENESQAGTARKSSTFGSAVKSLRQEFREAMASDSHSTSSSAGSSGTPVTSATAFSVSTSAQVAISSETPDLSDLLKSFEPRGESAKSDGPQNLNAASNQAVKRVSMSGHETSRDFSFTRDQSSNSAAVRSEAAQAKGGDSVRSAIFSQIIERIEFFKGPQQIKVMTLQLKPESLGKLEMQLATKDGAVTARISAENSLVKEKLEQLVPQIREHLAEQGVNILQISVDISRRESDGSEKGFSNGEYQHGMRIGSRRASRGSSSDTGGSESSVLINPEIRRMALHIKAVDVTV